MHEETERKSHEMNVIHHSHEFVIILSIALSLVYSVSNFLCSLFCIHSLWCSRYRMYVFVLLLFRRILVHSDVQQTTSGEKTIKKITSFTSGIRLCWCIVCFVCLPTRGKTTQRVACELWIRYFRYDRSFSSQVYADVSKCMLKLNV